MSRYLLVLIVAFGFQSLFGDDPKPDVKSDSPSNTQLLERIKTLERRLSELEATKSGKSLLPKDSTRSIPKGYFDAPINTQLFKFLKPISDSVLSPKPAQSVPDSWQPFFESNGQWFYIVPIKVSASSTLGTFEPEQ